MSVLLFDIDGTLIHTGGAGMAALKEAFRQEFGVAEPAEVPVSGRTDRGIARNLFRAHDVADSEENWSRFRDRYLWHLEAQLPQRTGRILPGVTELLQALTGRSQVLVGLLTGNVRAGARLKLTHFSLMHHFGFGGFGDHHADRDKVAGEALAEGMRHWGEKPFPAERVWVIGDTPLDISCARAIGARVMAVATGSFPRDVLAEFHPDVVLDSLTDTASVLKALVPE